MALTERTSTIVGEPCRLTFVNAPATHAQRHAWSCLWRLLLAEREPDRGTTPKNVEAPGTAIPEASKNCGPECIDQAAPTASLYPSRDER